MTTTILDRRIEPFAECLTTEAARKISAFKADDVTQQRIDALAEKANQGVLTPMEQFKCDDDLVAFHSITIMQARAHRFLQDSRAVPSPDDVRFSNDEVCRFSRDRSLISPASALFSDTQGLFEFLAEFFAVW
jgi:hypothetical protein